MAGYPVEPETKDNGIIPIITIAQPEETEAYQGTIEEKQWDEDQAAMEDLSFVWSGDLEETDAGDGVNIARILSSESMITDEVLTLRISDLNQTQIARMPNVMTQKCRSRPQSI